VTGVRALSGGCVRVPGCAGSWFPAKMPRPPRPRGWPPNGAPVVIASMASPPSL